MMIIQRPPPPKPSYPYPGHPQPYIKSNPPFNILYFYDMKRYIMDTHKIDKTILAFMSFNMVFRIFFSISAYLIFYIV